MNEIKPGQSIELLKHLHILTRDGQMNQDSRRKLKQVYHLCQFIEPLLNHFDHSINIVDHGAGKSYLGFILNDLFLKNQKVESTIFGIDTREELVNKSKELASRLGFRNMQFLSLSVADSINSNQLPETVDMVTALHACDTATDDAITFALEKRAKFIVLVPCCQAEIAGMLRKNKVTDLSRTHLTEMWRHPLHTREFGAHVTNVLRCMQLEANGYQVTVTELVGWEHSMKNELIIAELKNKPAKKMAEKIQSVLNEIGLTNLAGRYIPKF
jgi:hypothetical protein